MAELTNKIAQDVQNKLAEAESQRSKERSQIVKPGTLMRTGKTQIVTKARIPVTVVRATWGRPENSESSREERARPTGGRLK